MIADSLLLVFTILCISTALAISAILAWRYFFGTKRCRKCFRTAVVIVSGLPGYADGLYCEKHNPLRK